MADNKVDTSVEDAAHLTEDEKAAAILAVQRYRVNKAAQALENPHGPDEVVNEVVIPNSVSFCHKAPMIQITQKNSDDQLYTHAECRECRQPAEYIEGTPGEVDALLKERQAA